MVACVEQDDVDDDVAADERKGDSAAAEKAAPPIQRARGCSRAPQRARLLIAAGCALPPLYTCTITPCYPAHGTSFHLCDCAAGLRLSILVSRRS